MHEVETPDGIIEFPDDMAPEDITAALNKQYAPTPQQLAAFSLQQGISLPSKVASMYGAGAAAQRKMLEEESRPRPRLYGGEPALPEATPEVLGTAVQYGMGKAQELTESLAEMRSDFLRRTGIDPSAMVGRNIFDITPQGLVPGGQPGVKPSLPIGVSPLDVIPQVRKFREGVESGAAEFAGGLISQPEMLPFLEAKPVQAFFGAQAAAAIPESIKQIYQAKTPEELGAGAFGAAANIAMGGLIGRHLLTGKGLPNARSIEEAAKVYGDLRSQPIEGEGQVPAAEGGAGVLPQAQAVAEAAHVPLRVLDADELLHPVETQLLQNIGAAHGLRGEVRVIENRGETDPDNNVPFMAEFAQANEDGSFKAPGTITVSRDALRNWLGTRIGERLDQHVASALAEEITHSFTLPKEALDYLKTLTEFERKTREKLYLGEYTPETVPGGWHDLKLGAEVLRQHVQELMNLTPNEIIERAKTRTGQWTKDGLYILAKIIKRMREFIGTKAAREGQAISEGILDRMEQNVNAASEAIGEDAPFLIKRGDAARDFEDKSGFTFNPAKQIGGMTFEGLSAEQLKALKDAGYGPQWEFTDRRRGSPTEGMTFYVPEGSTPEQINAAYQKKLAGEPAAAMVRRGKKGEEEPTLPGMAATKGKGVLTKPETAPAAARPEFVKEPATPLAVDKASYEHFYTMAEQALTPKGKAISFPDYAAAMRVKFGPISTPALVEAFDRNMWPALMGLSGDKIAALRDKMNLRKDVGAREVSDPPQREGLLKGEVAPARAREERKARAARQNYRNTVISAIGRKLTEDTLAHVEKQGSLTRTEVSPFDLWKPRDRRTGKMKQKAPVQPIYNELTTEERNSPVLLEKVLTDDAREMKAGTVSATKRLTVLQHRDTGKVEMVSTFRDPRRGAVLLDPQSPSGTHSPLRSIFERYRPIASVLLDDPVKSFRKSFNSLADYEAEFGKDARSAAQPTFGERPMGEEEIPGVPIYRPDEPITRNEAMAIVDHVESEVGGLNSAEAVKASLESLPERLAQGERRLKESYYRGKRNVPTPEDVNTRSAASAYLKQMTVLAEKFPDASVDELVTRLADQIYENHKAAANIDEFVTRTMAQGAPEAGEVLPTGVPSPVPGRVESVIPKLSVEPRVIPGGRGGAFIPKEEPSKMLTPEEQAYVKSQATPEYPASLRHILYRQLAQAKVPEKPYTVGKDYTPVEREKGEDVDGPEEGAAMLTRRDIRDKAEAKFWTSLGQIRTLFTRHGTKQDIASVAARASTLPINLSQEAKREIELWSASKKNKDGDPKVLAAARAINAAYVGGMPDQAQLTALHTMTTDAQAKAAALLRVPTDLTLQVLGLGDIKGLNRYEIMNMARQWLHAAEDLQKEVEYAQTHFGEQNLMRTTRALRRELKSQLQWERNHGRNTKEAENYLPGLYKGEIYGDNSVTFESQILGKQFGKPKSFANTYEAIQAGPFIPKLNNVAEIAAHRIRSGLNAVLTDEAFHAPLHMTDPATGTPIAVPMDFDPKTGYTVPKGLEQYRPVYPLNGGPPMAVRRSYAGLMEDLFSNKGLTERNPFLRGLVQFGAIEKHSTLAGDAYHFFKMMDFGLSVMRTRFGWKSGYSALEYRPGNMAEAVRRGLLRQKDMDWALTPEQVNVGGTVQTMTRQEISKFLQDQGLNVGRVQDAMYKHFVDELDVTLGGKRLGLGRYTRFLFDKFTRGIMNQAAVESFIRHNKDLVEHHAGPGGALIATPPSAERIAKRIIGDVNTMFGSAGKQALIKNPTLRDISQLLLLAPQWTGTRISMEARFLSRLATTPYVAARYGLPEARLHAGPIGRGVGTGLVMMFGLTQVINLLSRHHLTFQNPEEGHKLDAYIPDPGGGPGFFVSPLSIFMEMTHDVARFMAAGHKNFMETLTQIASNKMHPVARGVLSGITGFTPTGQKITTMGGRAKAVATGMIPVPISGSALGRYIGHTLTDRVAPNAPGAGGRQLASTFGIKAEVAERATSQLDKLAKDYMERNKIKPPTGWEQVQTDEPNYTKLRSAIRAGDNREAIRLIQILRDEHPPKATKSGKQIDPVVRAMEQNAKRNFTTKEEENAFYNSLTPGQKRIYEKSIDDREAELEKFYRLYDKVP